MYMGFQSTRLEGKGPEMGSSLLLSVSRTPWRRSPLKSSTNCPWRIAPSDWPARLGCAVRVDCSSEYCKLSSRHKTTEHDCDNICAHMMLEDQNLVVEERQAQCSTCMQNPSPAPTTNGHKRSRTNESVE
ncbi:hypothetical protein B0H21DRAFT_886299 [Amylocystis lapponica]|nr:hypothetical protein B0H21DRAFT_886299 [Amylocystis lapponica]